jgi:hypothetical protein
MRWPGGCKSWLGFWPRTRIGGGILDLASRLTVSHSTFLANQAIGGTGGGPARGGGIDTANGSTATITESTFIGNRPGAGAPCRRLHGHFAGGWPSDGVKMRGRLGLRLWGTD